MNRIIYTIFKTLAALFVLFIILSISALAQSFTLHNIALLVFSVICLNKCCVPVCFRTSQSVMHMDHQKLQLPRLADRRKKLHHTYRIRSARHS